MGLDTSFFFYLTKLINFWLCLFFVFAQGFLQWGLLFAAVCRLHIVAASPAVEHRLEGVDFSGCGPRTPEHRFSCSVTCGIFLDQGSNVCLLRWQAHSLPLSHQGHLNHIPNLIAFAFLDSFVDSLPKDLCSEERWLDPGRMFLSFSSIRKKRTWKLWHLPVKDRTSLNIIQLLQEMEKQNEQDRLLAL